ncbi:hypothetical protein ACFQ40_00165 [Kroppenstedtia eburnea]|uniref:hypothetical protein n=1 Tax=Kroppenstedtia eburnea TaxID=714067 RepID=UPI003644FE34
MNRPPGRMGPSPALRASVGVGNYHPRVEVPSDSLEPSRVLLSGHRSPTREPGRSGSGDPLPPVVPGWIRGSAAAGTAPESFPGEIRELTKGAPGEVQGTGQVDPGGAR